MCPCPHGGTVLVHDTWHCVEAFFDGTNGVVKVYANGQMIIDEEAAPRIAYARVNFGYEQFHGPARRIWSKPLSIKSAESSQSQGNFSRFDLDGSVAAP